MKAVEWPFIGEHEPIVRVIRDGSGVYHGPVCPRCHRSSWRKVRVSSWKSIPKGEAWPQAHCVRCRVRWRLVRWNGYYSMHWGPNGANWSRVVAADSYDRWFQ